MIQSLESKFLSEGRTVCNVELKGQTLRQALTVRPRKGVGQYSTGVDSFSLPPPYEYFRVLHSCGSLIAGTNIHPHPPRYLGSYRSGTGRKSQKEPTPSRKKPIKSPKLCTQNQLQGTELPLVLESPAKLKTSAIDGESPVEHTLLRFTVQKNSPQKEGKSKYR